MAQPNLTMLGTSDAIGNKTNKNYGLVPRNIDAFLTLIDYVQPYIVLNISNLGNYTVKVQWSIKGCFKVDSTQLFYK